MRFYSIKMVDGSDLRGRAKVPILGRRYTGVRVDVECTRMVYGHSEKNGSNSHRIYREVKIGLLVRPMTNGIADRKEQVSYSISLPKSPIPLHLQWRGGELNEFPKMIS